MRAGENAPGGFVSARMTDQVPDTRGLRVVAHRQNFVTSVKYAG